MKCEDKVPGFEEDGAMWYDTPDVVTINMPVSDDELRSLTVHTDGSTLSLSWGGGSVGAVLFRSATFCSCVLMPLAHAPLRPRVDTAPFPPPPLCALHCPPRALPVSPSTPPSLSVAGRLQTVRPGHRKPHRSRAREEGDVLAADAQGDDCLLVPFPAYSLTI